MHGISLRAAFIRDKRRISCPRITTHDGVCVRARLAARVHRVSPLSTLWNARRTATVLRGSARCPAVEARQRTGIRACDAAAATTSRRPTLDTVRVPIDPRASYDRRSSIARAPVSLFASAAVAVGSTSYTWQQSRVWPLPCERCVLRGCHFLVASSPVAAASNRRASYRLTFARPCVQRQRRPCSARRDGNGEGTGRDAKRRDARGPSCDRNSLGGASCRLRHPSTARPRRR